MEKADITKGLNATARARRQWSEANRKFQSDLQAVLRRLLLEATHNFMSVQDIVHASGLSPKRVRTMMRENGLSPHLGKRTLADTAAKALTENAALMGISPHDMDLTSPLAYLPMGREMRETFKEASVSKVTELEFEKIERWADDHFSQGEVAVIMRLVDDFGWRPPA